MVPPLHSRGFASLGIRSMLAAAAAELFAGIIAEE
jgi:hypothetical protein